MKTNKISYGLLAISPVVFLILGFLLLMLSAVTEEDTGPDAPVFALASVGFFMLTGILGVIGMIVFLMHANKNPAIDNDSRQGWIIGIVTVQVVIPLVYYYMYIFKEQSPIKPASDTNPSDPNLGA